MVERIGPYHAARFERVSEDGALTVIELNPASSVYCWDQIESVGASYQRMEASRSGMGRIDLASVEAALEHVGPDVVFLNGWADRGALSALRWCLRRRVPAVLMSDSQKHDEKRIWWKEWIKRRIIAGCDAALVAGRRHADYLRWLGFGDKFIAFGYDVVDNDHFARGADAVRRMPDARCQWNLPEHYFLCVSRFIAKKNLPVLLQAFAAYSRQAGEAGWALVLLGDGELRDELEALIVREGLERKVYLPGFLQYDDLPAYYGLADAFVLASTSDQWGLSVNEAMAAGLPVLISRVCGCVPELVEEGVNGRTFDSQDEVALAQEFARLADPACDLEAMGAASRRIIANWSLERFSTGFREAAHAARRQVGGTAHRGWNALLCRLTLTLMLRKP